MQPLVMIVMESCTTEHRLGVIKVKMKKCIKQLKEKKKSLTSR